MKLLNLKEEIKEILEELENMYEISELEEQVNNINKIRDYIINLQQENKQLKEQLLATQTNEETFRLEMEDMTRILGLDEDIIFDDVKTYARSLKENKILRENAEHNDKVVDKVNWENMLLKKENQELKKQLEENKDKINWYENFEINKTIDKLRIKHNNQQKEFIEWLEAMSKMYENEYKDIDIAGHYNCVLAKYKEIIGDDK